VLDILKVLCAAKKKELKVKVMNNNAKAQVEKQLRKKKKVSIHNLLTVKHRIYTANDNKRNCKNYPTQQTETGLISGGDKSWICKVTHASNWVQSQNNSPKK